MNRYLLEVRRACKKMEHKEKIVFLKSYLNTKLKSFGLSVGEIRKIQKNGFSFFSKTEVEIKDIWHNIFLNAQHFEVLSQVLIYFQYRKQKLTLKDWKKLKQWSRRIDNWEHSDRLSDLYAELHEKYSKTVYPTFQLWNKSKNPWLRRLSIVSLFLYAKQRKVQPSFNKVLPLVHNLLLDNHFYVQKGVGWTLRELYNVYPNKTWRYLVKHVKEIKPPAWQAATEKLKLKDKKQLIKFRSK